MTVLEYLVMFGGGTVITIIAANMRRIRPVAARARHNAREYERNAR